MDPAPPAVAHIHNHGSVGLKADVADGPGERGRGRAAALLLLPVRHQLQHRKVIAAVDGVVPAHRGCLLQGGRARYSLIASFGATGERNDASGVVAFFLSFLPASKERKKADNPREGKRKKEAKHTSKRMDGRTAAAITGISLEGRCVASRRPPLGVSFLSLFGSLILLSFFWPKFGAIFGIKMHTAWLLLTFPQALRGARMRSFARPLAAGVRTRLEPVYASATASGDDPPPESLSLRVPSPALLLNHMADRYGSTSRILMEFVDNSLDDAESLYEPAKGAYRRDGRALQTLDPLAHPSQGSPSRRREVRVDVFVSRRGRRLRIVDNSRGMPPETLARVVMRVGESRKRGASFVNGQFGFGMQSFRAACSSLTVRSAAADRAHQIRVERSQSDGFLLEPLAPTAPEAAALCGGSGTEVRGLAAGLWAHAGGWWESDLTRANNSSGAAAGLRRAVGRRVLHRRRRRPRGVSPL